jgi:DNA primase
MRNVNQEIIDEIIEVSNDQIDLVFSELDIDIDLFRGFNNQIRRTCPIHNNADNKTAFCWDLSKKEWRCYTRNCHEGRSNIFGLVSAVKNISYYDSILWLGKLLKINIKGELNTDPEQDAIRRIVKTAKYSKHRDLEPNKEYFNPFPLEVIKNKVEPSWYFLNQGFTKETLIDFNIGFCNDRYKPMYLRSFAPILDENGKMVVGVTGRIKYEKCDLCGDFHEQNNKGCPIDNPEIRAYPKWLHHGFNKSCILYNYASAKESIRKTNTAIITEGPKDIWWLKQHGIDNAVCIFGLAFHSYHKKALIKAGATNIVLALNNDEAGQSGIERAKQSLDMYFKLRIINNLLKDSKDFAEIKSDRMFSEVVPELKNICQIN